MKGKIPIKVVMLVSYDYKYVYDTLPLLYNNADIICLSIDKNRQTWSGNYYELPDSFFERIKELDSDNKIQIYEDCFYDSSLSPMQNDTRQRNMTRDYVGKDGWCVQIDSDEYFYDFEAFTEYLQTLDPQKPHNVYIKWINTFKQDEDGFFVINSLEKAAVAVINIEKYKAARTVKLKRTRTYFTVVHHSWARSSQELEQKLTNWSHKDDFDTGLYFQKWQKLNVENYREYKNFHPMRSGKDWKSLSYIQARDIRELMAKIPEVKRKIMFKHNFLKSIFALFFRPGFYK